MAKRRANGEGTIYYNRQRDCWVAIMLLPSGKRKYFYASTREQVARRLRDAQRRRDDCLPIVMPDTTFGAFLLSWLPAIESTVKPGTYRRYEEIVRIHLIPACGRVKLATLAPQHFNYLYNDMLARGYAPASVVHVHATARRALNHALRWGVVLRNVVLLVDPPRIPRRSMQTWTPTETRGFLATAKGDRHEALYVLALTTGIRQGELFALRWEHVDLNAGLVQVRGTLRRTKAGIEITEPKTGRSRQVVLSTPAIEALQRHRDAQAQERLRVGCAWRDTGLVFTNTIGGPLEAPNLLRKSFKPLIKRAGVPLIRFHDLRHTAATLLLGERVHPKVVSEMLGHSQVSITLDIYSHVTPTMHADAARTFDKLLSFDENMNATLGEKSSTRDRARDGPPEL